MIFGLLLLFFLYLIDFSKFLHDHFAVFAEGDLNFERILIFVGNFEQGMERVFGFFAFRAKVIILANEAFVNDSFDWEGKTSIALDIFVQYFIDSLLLSFIFTNETKLLSFYFCLRLIFKFKVRIFLFFFLERHISDTSIHDLNFRDFACNLLHLHISETFFNDKRKIAELSFSYCMQHFFSESYILVLFEVKIKLQGQPIKAPPHSLSQLLQTSNFLHIDILPLPLILHLQCLIVHAITNNS